MVGRIGTVLKKGRYGERQQAHIFDIEQIEKGKKYYWEQHMHQLIYDKLKSIARAQSTITYSEIAPLDSLDMSNPADRNEIARILGEISSYEYQQGRPMLSVVVILQEQNIPGQGFFTLAKELGV